MKAASFTTLAAAGVMGTSLAALAATPPKMKMTTPITESVSTPDILETSWLPKP